MKAGVACLAGVLLLAACAPFASATSSSVVIGYFQGFDLQVNAVEGNLCAVGGVPTPDGLTAPSTGQTVIAFTPNTGVHTIPVRASEGFTAVDAVLSPDPSLAIETSDGLSLAFNVTSAQVGDVASVTIVLQDSSSNAFNCSATVTFTVVEAPACSTPPPPGSVSPYPPSGPPLVQNPAVSVTIINQVVSIVQVQYNVNIQVTTNNYNSYTCVCCFNSCNTIVVTPPAPPVSPAPPTNVTAPPPEASAPPPEASAPPPETSAPPPVVVETSPPPPADAPSPSTDEESESSGSA